MSVKTLSALVPPALTTTQRNALPTSVGRCLPGSVIFNTTTARVEMNIGSDATPNWAGVPPNAGDSLASMSPGQELAYAQNTATVNITATTEATAQTLVTAAAITGDGTSLILVEFFAMAWEAVAVANADIRLSLWDGGTSLGQIGALRQNTSTTQQFTGPVYTRVRLTPSAASHTYAIKGHNSAAGTGVIFSGAGGAGNAWPMYVRLVKA